MLTDALRGNAHPLRSPSSTHTKANRQFERATIDAMPQSLVLCPETGPCDLHVRSETTKSGISEPGQGLDSSTHHKPSARGLPQRIAKRKDCVLLLDLPP